MGNTHERFNRVVWAFKKDFTANLAKCLVAQSPYTVPDNLEKILEEFHQQLPYTFDKNEMAEVGLAPMTGALYEVMENIPELMALNERKNGRDGMGISSRYSEKPHPDDDFIDIMAVAQNITCEFATKEDAECWLNIPSIDS